mgnify:CR=1 FL=1
MGFHTTRDGHDDNRGIVCATNDISTNSVGLWYSNTYVHWPQHSFISNVLLGIIVSKHMQSIVTRVNWTCKNNIVKVNLEDWDQFRWVIANNYFKLAYQLTFDLTKLVNLHTF